MPVAERLTAPLQEARDGALTDHVIEWAGKPVKSIKKAIARTAERAGVDKVSPYVLRHTAAVWMAQRGVDMAKISEYLGHESTATTEKVYARFHPEYLKEASDAIDDALWK